MVLSKSSRNLISIQKLVNRFLASLPGIEVI